MSRDSNVRECQPLLRRPGQISFVATDLCLVLLTPQPDGFPQASECRQRIASALERPSDFRTALLECLSAPQYAIDDLGVPEVRHCLFRIPGTVAGLEQYTAPRTGRLAGPQSPYRSTQSVRRLLRHLMTAHARVHANPSKPLREYVQLTESEMIIAWCASDYEFYASFSPLASKPVAYAACHKLLRKLKKETPNLFMLHPVIK